jgi:hypothetical protein
MSSGASVPLIMVLYSPVAGKGNPGGGGTKGKPGGMDNEIFPKLIELGGARLKFSSVSKSGGVVLPLDAASDTSQSSFFADHSESGVLAPVLGRDPSLRPNFKYAPASPFVHWPRKALYCLAKI